jgi:hypothetical protein
MFQLLTSTPYLLKLIIAAGTSTLKDFILLLSNKEKAGRFAGVGYLMMGYHLLDNQIYLFLVWPIQIHTK